MLTILLVIIYIAFISLGLPDSLLGAAWPAMHMDFGITLSAAGIISMTVQGGTIVSSFMSSKVIGRFGTGKVTAVSVLMTAVALLGFSFAPSFRWLWVCAVPLGLGAGAVDAALNNFVALHYKARHMSWLHCFWGIGATGGPLVLSLFLAREAGWRSGYLVVSILQFALAAVLLFVLPAWKKVQSNEQDTQIEPGEKTSLRSVFRLPVIKYTLISFFCYSAVEATAGLWGSSYLVNTRGLSAETAARYISFFYMGITAGRFLSGFVTMKFTGSSLVRLGQALILLGLVLILQPAVLSLSLIGIILVGLGCAPIYPSLLHDTPKRVGKVMSQTLMGIQMGVAYTGSTLMPPLFGLIAERINTALLPVYLLFFLAFMILCTELANRTQKHKNESKL